MLLKEGEKNGIVGCDNIHKKKRVLHAEGLKTLRAMWKQDPAGQLERAGRLVGKWKDES